MDNNQNNYTNPYGAPQDNQYSVPPQNQYEAPQQNAYSAPSYSQPANNTAVPGSVKALSIVSLATGILGLVFCWYPYGVFLISSIASVVTNKIAASKSLGRDCGKFTSMAKAGKITGIIGLILNILSMIIWIAIFVIAAFAEA